MLTEEQRQIIVSTLALSDARQLEKYLERKAELISELQYLEKAIEQKTKDLYYLTGGRYEL